MSVMFPQSFHVRFKRALDLRETFHGPTWSV
jgi:hypothetical protein